MLDEEQKSSESVRIIRLEAENRRLWNTRLCWRDGVRICDTDRGPEYTCGKPATMLWIDPRGDDLYLCGQDCLDYILRHQGGSVKEIGKAHGFTVYEFTPEPEENEESTSRELRKVEVK